MRKIYSAAILAYHLGGVTVRSGTVMAQNEEEAEGIALKHARRIYPASEGYSYHQASVGLVPQEYIDEVTNNER